MRLTLRATFTTILGATVANVRLLVKAAKWANEFGVFDFRHDAYFTLFWEGVHGTSLDEHKRVVVTGETDKPIAACAH